MKSYKIPDGYNFIQSIRRTIRQVKDPIGTMQESMLRFDGTYSVTMGMTNLIVTQDPLLIDYVLRGNHRNFDKSPIQTKTLGRFLGKGLLTSNGDYWLKQRRLIQPGFHAERIHALYGIIEDTIDNFLQRMPAGRVDVAPLMNKLAFEVVINTLFNIRIEENIQKELARLIYELQDYVIRDVRQVYKRWWFRLSGDNARHIRKSQRVREIILQIIRDRKNSSKKYHDLLDMLLEAKYEDNGEHMTEEQLIDEITILIIAGHETTANALAWTLHLLATNTEEQSKVIEAAKGVSVSEAVMSQTLNAVINESMRLFPPAWISDRICLKDARHNSFDIPAGTIMVLFYYGMHRDKKHWTDPDAFHPDRFVRRSGDKEKSKTYYPFGAGPRLCIGNNFAMAEMTIFLQRFFSRYKVIATDQQPRLIPLVTLKPDKIVLKIEPLGSVSGDESH